MRTSRRKKTKKTLKSEEVPYSWDLSPIRRRWFFQLFIFSYFPSLKTQKTETYKETREETEEWLKPMPSSKSSRHGEGFAGFKQQNGRVLSSIQVRVELHLNPKSESDPLANFSFSSFSSVGASLHLFFFQFTFTYQNNSYLLFFDYFFSC